MEAALCVLESKQVVGQPVNITSIKYTCFLATSIVSCIICVTNIHSFRFKNFDTKINEDQKDFLFLVSCLVVDAQAPTTGYTLLTVDPRSSVSAAE